LASDLSPAEPPFLAVVIPAYNEEQDIRPTLDQITRYLSAQTYSWTVLVVDDGSTDGTASIVETFASDQPHVKLLSEPHRGKGAAVQAGMLHTTAQYRFLCDADLSMSIEQLARFLPPALTDYDIALGSREVAGARRFDEPRRRHIMGRLYNGITRTLAVPGVLDTQCGFKCFLGTVADRLFPIQRTSGFGFDVEILYLARRIGLRLVEVPIDWYYGTHSKVRPIQDGFTMTADILRVRWNTWRGRYKGLT
jgi:dolichyl-phosphate beta-glucosyltransferase